MILRLIKGSLKVEIGKIYVDQNIYDRANDKYHTATFKVLSESTYDEYAKWSKEEYGITVRPDDNDRYYLVSTD